MAGMRYPDQGADFERSFRVLRSLPADIWVTQHATKMGQVPQVAARATAKNPADTFIDPEGYRAYIDTAEAEIRSGRTSSAAAARPSAIQNEVGNEKRRSV